MTPNQIRFKYANDPVVMELIDRVEQLTDALLDARHYVPRNTLKSAHIEDTLETFGAYVDLESAA